MMRLLPIMVVTAPKLAPLFAQPADETSFPTVQPCTPRGRVVEDVFFSAGEDIGIDGRFQRNSEPADARLLVRKTVGGEECPLYFNPLSNLLFERLPSGLHQCQDWRFRLQVKLVNCPARLEGHTWIFLNFSKAGHDFGVGKQPVRVWVAERVF